MDAFQGPLGARRFGRNRLPTSQQSFLLCAARMQEALKLIPRLEIVCRDLSLLGTTFPTSIAWNKALAEIIAGAHRDLSYYDEHAPHMLTQARVVLLLPGLHRLRHKSLSKLRKVEKCWMRYEARRKDFLYHLAELNKAPVVEVIDLTK